MKANESFLSTAIEYNNVIKHGDAVGFKYDNVRATYGQVNLYIKVPVNSSNTGPDLAYAPKLRAGSTFSATNGSIFTLLEDVDFADTTNETVVATTNSSTGIPVEYAIKTIGQVVSGELREKTFDIGAFSRVLTSSEDLRYIAAGDTNTWMAIDRARNVYISTDNAATWSTTTSIPGSDAPSGLAYNNGTWVVITDGTVDNILKSTNNGTSWTAVASTGYSMHDVAVDRILP